MCALSVCSLCVSVFSVCKRVLCVSVLCVCVCFQGTSATVIPRATKTTSAMLGVPLSMSPSQNGPSKLVFFLWCRFKTIRKRYHQDMNFEMRRRSQAHRPVLAVELYRQGLPSATRIGKRLILFGQIRPGNPGVTEHE